MVSAAQADARARRAELSITERHLRRLLMWPVGQLGVVTDPAPLRQRAFVDYNYWWQAHLLDCLIDAERREPHASRRRVICAVPRALWVRNRGSIVNDYFDDMAWLALALGRMRDELGISRRTWERRLIGELYGRWHDDAGGGGIPWRRGDVFRNVPANGTAAIVLARVGKTERAQQTVEWLYRHLHDATTGLFIDGRRPDGLDRRIFTYNQGVVLGALLALPCDAHSKRRVEGLVEAVADHCTTEGVLHGRGGGDGGLFAAIAARYLAAAALAPQVSPLTRSRAAAVVMASAEAAWAHRVQQGHHVWFGPDWSSAAVLPRRGQGHSARSGMASSVPAERDLSVQLGGWMVAESAARLARAARQGDDRFAVT